MNIRAPVLATGGGSVLREANRASLRGGGKVVYLRSSPEELFRRLRHDRQRPLLQVADPQKRLRELYQQRDPLYRDAADFADVLTTNVGGGAVVAAAPRSQVFRGSPSPGDVILLIGGRTGRDGVGGGAARLGLGSQRLEGGEGLGTAIDARGAASLPTTRTSPTTRRWRWRRTSRRCGAPPSRRRARASAWPRWHASTA